MKHPQDIEIYILMLMIYAHILKKGLEEFFTILQGFILI